MTTARYNACANRAYFAAFQAAIAALLDQGAKRGNFDHKWVQAEFSRKLIKRRKIYPGRLSSHLMKMQGVRNRADYSDKGVSKSEASQQIKKAQDMLTFIGKELEK
ncbi:HEPN domain-containing protein [Desulfonema magnum]|uniref:HEPN domain-containing protein n=1 Tax=Desulfonema magnum TaxID=45655 RepID=A0A975GS22_9BACT|nr:HEPN domain-containing protein [Desulfonema magnum]QTA91467.1 HEPN domain-containing protein [Desulfonema magnum]